MKFSALPIAGAVVIDPEPHVDERGFFARTFCSREFEAAGLDSRMVQCSVSYNARAGTLRGMHWQAAPHEEAKLVRCTAGALYDVLLDLRPTSPTHGQWTTVELRAADHRAVYVPPGVAHGFQTLVDGTEVLYQMSAEYHPECSRGLRWDDPAYGIRWPIADPIVSERDRSYPLMTTTC